MTTNYLPIPPQWDVHHSEFDRTGIDKNKLCWAHSNDCAYGKHLRGEAPYEPCYRTDTHSCLERGIGRAGLCFKHEWEILGRPMELVVIDLFSGLGGWSQPFKDRGHRVLTLDNDPRFGADLTMDIRDFHPSDLPEEFRQPDVVLASPPCTYFTVMRIGRNWTGPKDRFPHSPRTPEAVDALALVYHTRHIISKLDPVYFAIENPVGKLRRLNVVADLPRVSVTYCQYGERRMKPTDIWGQFPRTWNPRPSCKPGMGCHVSAPRGSKTGTQGMDPAESARIPYELAAEFCHACERG